MLLGVSFGVAWTGLCLALSGYKQWDFASLMIGKWGVTTTSQPNDAGSPAGGNQNVPPGQPGNPYDPFAPGPFTPASFNPTPATA